MKSSTASAKLAFTVEEVSDLISISRAQLFRLIEQGELRSVTIGRSRRITLEQLRAFLRSLEQREGFRT